MVSVAKERARPGKCPTRASPIPTTTSPWSRPAAPVTGSAVITLFLLAALVVGGATRIVIALQHRDLPLWWVLAVGGVVSVIVGVALYAAMPWSSLWILGTLIGVELIFQGVGWASFSFDLRKRHNAAVAGGQTPLAGGAASGD